MAGVTRPIVALDVPTRAAAVSIVERLGDDCDFYKVGLQLFAADGPKVVEWLRGAGKSVFVDLKAHDIPNTVRGAAKSVAALGASLVTVHGIGGEAMVRAAVDGANEASEGRCGVLVVTVLTSFDGLSYGAATGRGSLDIAAEVGRLAAIADVSHAQGVVCSGREAAMVAARFPELSVLVPGVREAGQPAQDQARAVTPEEAAEAGVAYVVLGRAVTTANDPHAKYVALKATLSKKALPQAT